MEGGGSADSREKAGPTQSTVRSLYAQGEGSQDVGLPLQNLEIGTPKSASSNRASTFFL